jgi:hypothetical protein
MNAFLSKPVSLLVLATMLLRLDDISRNKHAAEIPRV